MPAVQSRIVEMLDAIRVEFDQLAQEAYVCKSQRDDFELKSKSSFIRVVKHMLTVSFSERAGTRNESFSKE